MDIDYLNEFLITAKHRNVSEAARELNLSQPALSRHIASLESAVGATLFDRSTNPMELTEVGKEFQDHAWALYSDWLRLEAFMKTVRGKTFRTVRVAGVLASGAHHVVRQAQALMRQKEPYVSLSIEEVRQQTSFSMVREGTLDVAVEPLSSFVDAHGLKSVPLVRENAAVVVEAGHPLAKRERLDVDDLRRLSFTSLRSNRAYALRYHVRERSGASPGSRGACRRRSPPPRRTPTRRCSRAGSASGRSCFPRAWRAAWLQATTATG